MSAEGAEATRGRVRNISDGGVLVALPQRPLPACGSQVDVNLRVPRATANTYMLEEFTCRAQVVRHQGREGSPAAMVALAFTQPVKLALEV